MEDMLRLLELLEVVLYVGSRERRAPCAGLYAGVYGECALRIRSWKIDGFEETTVFERIVDVILCIALRCACFEPHANTCRSSSSIPIITVGTWEVLRIPQQTSFSR